MSAISARSVRCTSSYRDTIADQVSDDRRHAGFRAPLQRAARGRSAHGHLLAAVEAAALRRPFRDCPMTRARKMRCCATARATQDDGFSVTGMLYHQVWTNTTDIPLRAIAEDVGSQSLRHRSIPTRRRPAHGARACRSIITPALGDGTILGRARSPSTTNCICGTTSRIFCRSVHGDQEDQFENRACIGGAGELHAAASAGRDLQNEHVRSGF